MSAIPTTARRAALTWQSFESWVGSRASILTLFVVALGAFALQSLAVPVGAGRDIGRYVQAFIQLGYAEPILTSVADTRGPLASLGVGVPLVLGGAAVEIWLALLYAASIVAWSAAALRLGPRAAVLTATLLLVNPGYTILFHQLASDSLFAAAFAGWAVLLARAIDRPTILAFAVAGLGMGALVLVRPSNQILIVMTLLPFVLRAPLLKRAQWAAGFFVASTAVSQGWKAVMHLRYGDATGLRPSGAFLVVALALLVLLLPSRWRRRAVLASIPLLVIGVIARGGIDPTQDVRALAQSPSTGVFFYRAFEIDRIVSPDNGPASRQLADVVEQRLLVVEPYRSYGVDLDGVFTSGSDRIFGDINGVGDFDAAAVTEEAIRAHPWTFAKGIARTNGELLRARLVVAESAPPTSDSPGAADSPDGESFVVVNGRRLPRPSEGQPIPASHFGPVLHTLYGRAREVWRSPTEHSFVFDDPRDERRYAAFENGTGRLVERMPSRNANRWLAHKLNQASRLYPPPVAWLVLGAIAVALRRPRRSLVAIAPSVAALAVICGTALVTLAVPQYSLPVSPAFVLLAAAGLVGADPRRHIPIPWRGRQPA